LLPRQPGDAAKPRVRADAAHTATAHDLLTPVALRKFCALLNIPEKPAQAALRRCAQAAVDTWPRLVAQSGITPQMKANLLKHFEAHPAAIGLRKRQAKH
jgi:serine/threonine-protein kinase HipA